MLTLPRPRRRIHHTLEGRWTIETRQLAVGNDWPPSLLLELGERRLPGNARFALTSNGLVLVTERRIPEFVHSAWGAGDDASPSLFVPELADLSQADRIEAVLAASGLPWDSRGNDWFVPASGGTPELAIRQSPKVVTVNARLTDWEGELAEVCQEALGHFLCVMHGVIRCARFRMAPGSVHVASRASTERLDDELIDSLAAVAHVHRFLVRDVEALCHADMAAMYLQEVAARFGPRKS